MISDLFIFVGLVALVVVVSVGVGMIVAGRIDRIQASRPAAPAEPASDQQEERS